MLKHQKPILCWHPDLNAVAEAHFWATEAGIPCSAIVTGDRYSLFCGHLDEPISKDLEAKLRALVSHVQVSMTPRES